MDKECMVWTLAAHLTLRSPGHKPAPEQNWPSHGCGGNFVLSSGAHSSPDLGWDLIYSFRFELGTFL